MKLISTEKEAVIELLSYGETKKAEDMMAKLGLRYYALVEAGYVYDHVWAADIDAALEQAGNNFYPSLYQRQVRDMATGECVSTTFAVEPPEPDCTCKHGHNWQAPYRVPGALRENWEGDYDDWRPALWNGTYWHSHKYTGECRRVSTRPKIRTVKGIKNITIENLKKFAAATGGELFDLDFQWKVEAIETQETLEQWWEESLLHWREQSVTKTGKIAGFQFLAWENAQVSRGQMRHSMSVVDLGDVRIVLPGTDLTDFKEK